MMGGRDDIRQRGIMHTSTTRPTWLTRVGSPCGKITGITARPGSGSRPVPPKNRNMFHQFIMTCLHSGRTQSLCTYSLYIYISVICTYYPWVLHTLCRILCTVSSASDNRWAKKRQRNNPEGPFWVTIGWEWLGGATCLAADFYWKKRLPTHRIPTSPISESFEMAVARVMTESSRHHITRTPVMHMHMLSQIAQGCCTPYIYVLIS